VTDTRSTGRTAAGCRHDVPPASSTNRTFTKARSCRTTSYVDAKGTSLWSLKLGSLPQGRYTIWARGIDAAGNVERKGRGRNLVVLTIPAHRKAPKKAPATSTKSGPVEKL
jgi:hypothetical protein